MIRFQHRVTIMQANRRGGALTCRRGKGPLIAKGRNLGKARKRFAGSRHRRIDTRVFASAQETGRESSVTTHAPAVGAHCADQSFVHHDIIKLAECLQELRH
jgi:hypothetical protein